MSAQRLPQGGRIDRARMLRFSWDGKTRYGYQGDTLASALMAGGDRVLGRSFKYHRPRGIMSAGVEESGALVTVGEGARRDPNVKASVQELYDGLVACGQNAWPGVRYDVGAVNNLFGRFLAAGFYYKTFMRLPLFGWNQGTRAWMWYEKWIRRAAGMGTASRQPDPDEYEHGHAFCDLLVVGSGPAGLAAASAAAQAGLDVVLVEQDCELGGDWLNQPTAQAEPGRAEQVAAMQAAGVRVMLRTTVFGLYDHGVAGLLERVSDHIARPDAHTPRHRFWTLRAQQTILATGALERSIAFGNNDRPGVMTAAAGRAYLNRYGVLPGRNVVVAGNNDSVYPAAVDLAQAGARVMLLDARTVVPPALVGMAGEHGITLRTNSAPLCAVGGKAVKGLRLAAATADGWHTAGHQDCDLVLVSGGWSPVVNLICHRGVMPVWDDTQACFVAPPTDQPIRLAGAAAGVWPTAACLASGLAAGRAAAAALGRSVEPAAAVAAGGWEGAIQPLYEVRVAGKKHTALVDFQHDVTADDIRLAAREGFAAVEHLKRYTTLGMATDGGKMGNVVGLALMAEALGKTVPQVGTTMFRPPYTPVSLGALSGRSVGRHFRLLRRTPMHDWNLQQGATMQMAGLWHRPWYFAAAGEDLTAAYIREAKTTRACVGLCDVTSLGKIAIQGPDAAEFLNRVYTNPFAKLPIGKARYGIMLRDDGMVMDDGTTWRLAASEYFMTTTTAQAAQVMVMLEHLLQTRWPELKVQVTSVSDQWAGVAVAGPQSREVLIRCVRDPDGVSDRALPFMGVVEAELLGDMPCRIARISFSGERAYEVYVPSDYGNAMIAALWAVAQPLGGCLYGLEALGALRIEKGHVTGAELDGRVTIDDAGLGRMASADKAFVGSALRRRPELMQPERPRLVGIKPLQRALTFNAGAILCRPEQVSGTGVGWITAVTHSPALGHWIGLGFIAGGHAAWQGKTVVAADPLRNSRLEVEIVSPHLYDPDGERMYG